MKEFPEFVYVVAWHDPVAVIKCTPAQAAGASLASVFLSQEPAIERAKSALAQRIADTRQRLEEYEATTVEVRDFDEDADHYFDIDGPF